MATIGLKDLYYAKITETADESGNITTTYAKPDRLAKAITAELSVETAEQILYADDAPSESVKEFKSGSLTLNVNDLSATTVAALLGQKADKNNVIFANSEDNAPDVAVGFRAKKSNGQYRYVWLFKTKFSTPNESYQTKGESIEFKTPELTAIIMARPDGTWKVDFTGEATSPTASAWFTNVYATAVPNTP